MNTPKILKLYDKIDSLQLTIDSLNQGNLPIKAQKWLIKIAKAQQNSILAQIKHLLEDK